MKITLACTSLTWNGQIESAEFGDLSNPFDLAEAYRRAFHVYLPPLDADFEVGHLYDITIEEHTP